jgi:serine/threonine-protein kinase
MVSQAKKIPAEKICPNCSAQYPRRAKFCPKDGTRLESTGDISGSVVASSAVTAEPSVAATVEQKSVGEEKWDPDSLIGKTVATHYKLVEKIGQGGMGVVYKADHIRISRPAAIKILNPDLAGDPEVVARFGREAEMASRLNHPNAVGIYDIGEEADGFVYIAMEYVDGEQLSKIIEREGFLTPLRAANIIRQVAGALDAAHQLKIVHRDLKPDNIMICKRAGKVDWVKVVDFGIAKQTQHGFGYQSVTRRGLILGTPEYMAPEQLLREPLDSRTDVYSLGLVAYKILTGKLPFTGKNSQARMVKKLTEKPRGFKEAKPDLNLSPEIEAIVMKAISRERNDRYSTTLEFSAALERAAGSNPLYDPAFEPFLQSASAAGGESFSSRTESTDSRTSDSEHQSTIITFPQNWTQNRPPDQPVPETSDSLPAVKIAPPTADAFPAVKETRPVTPNVIQPTPTEWPDHSQEDDISSWHSAPAHAVSPVGYVPPPVQSRKRSGWIFFIIAALLLIIAIVAALILWRMNQPQSSSVAEETPAATEATSQATSQPQPQPSSVEVQLPVQAEGRESMTISAPTERADNKPSRVASRNQSRGQPAEESPSGSASPTTETPPKEEPAEKSSEPPPSEPESKAEEKPNDAVRRSQGVVHGAVLRRVEPSYPTDASRRGVRGKVVVEVTIDENGRVASATVVSGPDIFRDAALRAARRWRFKPTLLNGVPSKSSRTIEFNFVKE